MIKAKSTPYLERGQPAKQPALPKGTDYTVVSSFGAVYRGIAQYYLLAGDVFRLHRLQWVMETSMLKTLAAKHRSTVSKMAAKHKAKIDTPNGPRVRFEVVSHAETESHWSHGSVEFPSSNSDRQPSSTAGRSWLTTPPKS
nr:group II intron reverse transcriptase/maturase [Streptomyces sp. TSRI0281]